MRRYQGFGLLELIFALAILMSVSPFVYHQMSQRTNDLKSVFIAKELDMLKRACDNYMSINSQNWPSEFAEDLYDQDLLYTMRDYGLSASFRHFSESISAYHLKNRKITTETDGAQITSYLIISLTDLATPLWATKLLEHLGNDAGYAEDGVVYGSQGAWQASIEGVDHAIVYRLFSIRPARREVTLLSRSSSLDNQNKMEIPLYMGSGNEKYNLENVKTIKARSIVVDERLQTNFLKVKEENESASSFYAQDAFFYNTLFLESDYDSNKPSFVRSLNVSQNLRLSGFSAFTLDSGSGALTIQAEDGSEAHLIISDKLTIYNLNLKNFGYSFSPHSFVADYLKVDHLTILDSFVVTTELQVQTVSWLDSNKTLKGLSDTHLLRLELIAVSDTCSVVERLENLYADMNTGNTTWLPTPHDCGEN